MVAEREARLSLAEKEIAVVPFDKPARVTQPLYLCLKAGFDGFICIQA